MKVNIKAKVEEIKNKYEGWRIKGQVRVPCIQEQTICDVAADNKNNIHVSSLGDSVLYVLTDAGETVSVISEAENKKFNTLSSVKLNKARTFLGFFDYRNNRIVTIGTDDYTVRHTYTFPGDFSLSIPFWFAMGMEIDDNDVIWTTVFEKGEKVLYKLDKDLKLLETEKIDGNLPAGMEFILPILMNDALYLLFGRDNSIYRLVDGKVEKIFQNPYGQFHYFTSDGKNLYASVYGTQYKVLKISPEGELIYAYMNEKIAIPSGLNIKADTLYITDRSGNKVWILEKK